MLDIDFELPESVVNSDLGPWMVQVGGVKIVASTMFLVVSSWGEERIIEPASPTNSEHDVLHHQRGDCDVIFRWSY